MAQQLPPGKPVGSRARSALATAKPSAALLRKIASMARRADWAFSPRGHEADAAAIRLLLADPDVRDPMTAMDAAALPPARS
jgi:hypothetical protein